MATPASATPVALPQEDDVELIAAVRRGDDFAFEQLYARYHRRISAYVRGMVKDYGRSEDITQEVFISALRRLRASDQEIALKAWLYEIARNACIDQYRRSQRAQEVLLEEEGPDAAPLVSSGPTPADAVDTRQTLDHLRHAFQGLSDIQHDILVMRELEGRSYREIGERLNLTRPAVESALFRARRRLMQEYEEVSSGTRCLRVQRAINSACTGSAAVRERWRIASHLSHCNACRRHARVSGLAPEFMSASVPARVAAVLPLPAFLRRVVIGRGAGRVGGVPAEHVSSVVNAAGALGSLGDPVSGWITAGAAAATVALAIGSASVIGTGSSSHHPASVRPAPAVGSVAGGGAGHVAGSLAAGRGAGRRSFSYGGHRAAANGGSVGTAGVPVSRPRSGGGGGVASRPARRGHGPLAALRAAAAPDAPAGAPMPGPLAHAHLGHTVGAALSGAAGAVGAAGKGGGSLDSATRALPPAGAGSVNPATQPVAAAVQGVAGQSTPQSPPLPPKP